MFHFKKTETRENIEAFALAVMAILFINIFVVQSFEVKGSSMEPTLQNGERLPELQKQRNMNFRE